MSVDGNQFRGVGREIDEDFLGHQRNASGMTKSLHLKLAFVVQEFVKPTAYVFAHRAFSNLL